MQNYAHYWEYKISKIKLSEIKEKITNKISVYDLEVDMKQSKFKLGQKLEKIELNTLPSYLVNNINKYAMWLD